MLDTLFSLENHLIEFFNLSRADLEALPDNYSASFSEESPLIISKDENDVLSGKANIWEKMNNELPFGLYMSQVKNKKTVITSSKLIFGFAKGVVLDYGGGIGTQTLIAASSPQVSKVIFWDINPILRDFVNFRVNSLNLNNKVVIPAGFNFKEATFNTIICLGLFEILEDPSALLKTFHQLLKDNGIGIFNWFFCQGEAPYFTLNNENPAMVEKFILFLQDNFVERFHPLPVRDRLYIKRK